MSAQPEVPLDVRNFVAVMEAARRESGEQEPAERETEDEAEAPAAGKVETSGEEADSDREE